MNLMLSKIFIVVIFHQQANDSAVILNRPSVLVAAAKFKRLANLKNEELAASPARLV